MTDTMTSQNIDLSSWDTLYNMFRWTYRHPEDDRENKNENKMLTTEWVV